MDKLSVIIVNYRSSEDILDCLESAFQFSSALSFEWVIVNNESKDSGKEIILAKFPTIKWIEMGYNAGFARANNKGIAASSGDTVLLLNPDTIVLDNAIAKCYQKLTESSCIASSVQLLNEDHTPQITGNFFMKGGLNHLLPLPYLGNLLRAFSFVAGVKKTNIKKAADYEKVDWINGAFLMVKKTAIGKAGLLDEDFFLYSEEIEWCSRLGKVGCLCVFGNLFTIHLQGESVNRITGNQGKGYADLIHKKGLQLMVSQHVRLRKQFGRGWFLFHLGMHIIGIPIFFIFSFFENIFHLRNPFSDWDDAWSYTKNVIALCGLMPEIMRNNPFFYKLL